MGFYLSVQAIIFLCQFVLATAIAVYLFSLRRKSNDTWWLAFSMAGFALFFGGLVLSASAATEANPAIDVLTTLGILGGLTASLGFAYHFVENLHPREWKWAVGLAGTAGGLWTVSYALDQMTTLSLPGRSLAVGVVATIFVVPLWTLVVHLRKTVRFSRRAAEPSQSWLSAIIQPFGGPARGNRAFGLLSIVILCIAALLGLSLVEALSGFETDTFLLLGFLAYVFAVVVVYANHSSEPTSLQVKIVSFALAMVVAILGITTLLVYDPSELARASDVEVPRSSLRFERVTEGDYRVLQADEPLDRGRGARMELGNGDSVPTAIGFPFPFGGTVWDTLYVDDDGLVSFGGGLSALREVETTELPLIAPYFTPLQPERGGRISVHRKQGEFAVTWDEVPHITSEQPVTAQLHLDSTGSITFRYGHIPADAVRAERGIYPRGKANAASEIGATETLPSSIASGSAFVQTFGDDLRAFIHSRVVTMAWILLGSTLFIVLVFPFLLRASITRPLASLLEGMRT